jgi:hypothetical protein
MGGAGGHMRHPFDLERVQSGNDLIEIFNDLKSYAQQAAEAINVKIDGINVSFKLVGNEFAVDRGSQKPIDVEGVTLSRIEERFGEGHGMIPAITNLLTILNEALPMIKPELKTLGLVDNPHYFLNTEYVMGATNAVGYSMNFIAIHGVNAFYEKYSRVPKNIAAQTGVSLIKARDGLPNPDNKKSGSVEVPYDSQAMMSLINKLNTVSQKHGFKVFGPIPTQKKEDVTIDYSSSLNTPFRVNVSEEYNDNFGGIDHLQGRPLKDWLSEIIVKPAQYVGRYDTMYKSTDGRRISPFDKRIYLAILEGNIPLDTLVVSTEDSDGVRALIDGAVLMHATRLLGNDFLKGLTSEIGDMIGEETNHEGVVIRDEQFSPYPFKVTGEFIVDVLSGGIAQKVKSENPISESKIRRIIREAIRRRLNLLF